jgi:hypothetical protein
MGDEMYQSNIVAMRRGPRPLRMRGMGDNEQKQEQSQGQSTTTAVSPTIQQGFTPQISPVFQQSSGGGNQSASTQQIAPGGQSGQGGSASGAPGYMPASAGGQGNALPSLATPGYGYTPSYGAGSNAPTMGDPFYTGLDYSKLAAQPSAVFQKKTDWTLYIVGAVVLAGLAWYLSQPKSKRNTGL